MRGVATPMKYLHTCGEKIVTYRKSHYPQVVLCKKKIIIKMDVDVFVVVAMACKKASLTFSFPSVERPTSSLQNIIYMLS